MTEPTKEQKQKFWEWCGFVYKDMGYTRKSGFNYHGKVFEHDIQVFHWVTETVDFGEHLPPIDLNSLFKWAVPKLIKPADSQGGIEFQYYPGGLKCIVTVESEPGFESYESFQPKEFDPAIVLFWAIWSVIND